MQPSTRATRRLCSPALAAFLALTAPRGDLRAQVAVEYIGPVSGAVASRVNLGTQAHTQVVRAIGRPDDLFVSRLDGRLTRVHLSDRSFNTFVDLPGVEPSGFYGLLGIAFHPDFAHNGRLYAHMSTDVKGETGDHHTTMIREFTLSEPMGDSSRVVSIRDILSWRQPGNDHNGGWIGFHPRDPDVLWITSGDGKNENPPGHDPFRNGQNPATLLAAILRIDVSGKGAGSYGNYSIPPDNPRATGDPTYAGWAPEVWAIGVRSPWGASFDRLTGDFVFGDVGSAKREWHTPSERIYFERDGSPGGRNYGWRVFEGTFCSADQDPGYVCGDSAHAGSPYTFPAHQYRYGGDYGAGNSPDFQGRSVTGGYVYRGPVEALWGKYVFGDWSSRQVWAVEIDRDAHGGRGAAVPGTLINLSDALRRPREGTEWVPDAEDFLPFGLGVAGFGEDAEGNLYFVEVSGRLFKVVSAG